MGCQLFNTGKRKRSLRVVFRCGFVVHIFAHKGDRYLVAVFCCLNLGFLCAVRLKRSRYKEFFSLFRLGLKGFRCLGRNCVFLDKGICKIPESREFVYLNRNICFLCNCYLLACISLFERSVVICNRFRLVVINGAFFILFFFVLELNKLVKTNAHSQDGKSVRGINNIVGFDIGLLEVESCGFVADRMTKNQKSVGGVDRSVVVNIAHVIRCECHRRSRSRNGCHCCE